MIITPRAVAVALLAALLVGCDAPAPSHPAIGRGMGPLPIAPLAYPDGEPPVLAGRVTLLNFWGPWCPPCRRELPGLARLAGRLAAEPAFQLVAVACGSGGEEPDELAHDTHEFLTSQNLSIRVWAFGTPLAASLFASAYGLEAFPTTYLIGPDARVRRVWRGYRPADEADIAAAVLAALKEVTLSPPRVDAPPTRAP
jgi:cytochrome c biogenesis protein CcmG, thiol:disulfide interchange protein DsbE